MLSPETDELTAFVSVAYGVPEPPFAVSEPSVAT
jgi:hypothetical protein